MTTAFIFGLSTCLFTYISTTLIGKFLIFKNDALESYHFFKDPYIYVFLLLLIIFLITGFFLPDYQDFIFPFRFSWLCISFIFAALIYFLYLLEFDRLLNLSVLLLSIISAFLFIPNSIAADIAPVSSFITKTIIGLLIGAVVFGAKTLIALPGVFSIVMLMLSLGLILISAAGGVPSYLGCMSASVLGVFTTIFQFNRFEKQFNLNEGAVISLTFLFCMLLLQGVNELAAPSMLILAMYILVELSWSLFFCFFLKRREPHLSFNTVYFSAFEKGFSLVGIHTTVFKLCVINIVLALFQLHAPNKLSLPVLTFVINIWLLSKVFYAGQKQQSFKEMNKTFIENVKNEIADVAQHLKKD